MKRATNESTGYLAAVEVAEPLKIPRTGGKFIGRGKGAKFVPARVCCDFAGTIRDGSGRMLVCDFKRTDEQFRYSTGDVTKLSPHQRDELVSHGRNNAVAGLLIESSATERQYWCPWDKLFNRFPGDWCTSVRFEEMLDLGPSSVVADLGRAIDYKTGATK